MDLAAHFAAMWRHRWIVLVASVLVAVITYAGLSLEHGKYQATAQLSVTAGQGANGQAIQDITPFLAQTYATLAKTKPVVDDAVRRSGLSITESTAAARLSVLNPGSIGFLQLNATGPSPHDAQVLDQGLSDALVAAVQTQQQQQEQQQFAVYQSEIQKLSQQIAALPANSTQRSALQSEYAAAVQSLVNQQVQQPNTLNVVSPAQAGSSPVAPNPKRDALLAFVTALVVIAELSVGYEVLSDRFSRASGEEEIRRVTNLPVLARIPRVGGPELVEAFRTLRTSLLFMNGTGKTQTIAVVSSAPQVGKSFVSINLASSFADLGAYAALVDADMRRPAIAGRLGIPESPGLSEALKGEGVADKLVTNRTDSGYHVFVLAAGSAVQDPAALLSSRLAEWVFPNMSGFETVVVDTPAEDLFPDASIVAARCEATILVIDADSTKRKTLKALADQLRQLGANPVGVVLNRSTETSTARGHYSRTGYYTRSVEAPQLPKA